MKYKVMILLILVSMNGCASVFESVSSYCKQHSFEYDSYQDCVQSNQ